MRKLFLGLILSATFLAGYYLGRCPDSPDIIGVARQKYHRLARTSKRLAATFGEKSSELVAAVRSEK